VERSHGKIRADVVHERLLAMASAETERTTRRAVAELKAAYRAGHRRSYRPWLPEPGHVAASSTGARAALGGRRYAPVLRLAGLEPLSGGLPNWDRKLGTAAGLPGTRLCGVWGGAPTYLADGQRAHGDH